MKAEQKQTGKEFYKNLFICYSPIITLFAMGYLIAGPEGAGFYIGAAAKYYIFLFIIYWLVAKVIKNMKWALTATISFVFVLLLSMGILLEDENFLFFSFVAIAATLVLIEIRLPQHSVLKYKLLKKKESGAL